MAKAEVTLTCPSCGREFTKSKNCYSRRDADSWEEWMRGQEGSYVCPSCYGKQMREKERQAADDLENRRKERRGIDSWAVEKHGLPEFDASKEGNFGASVRGRMIEIANEHGAKDEFWEMLKSIPADGKLWWGTIGTSYGSYMSGTGIEDDWNLYDVEKWITRLRKAVEAKSDRENLKNELDELFPMPEIPHIRDLCGVSSTARWNGKFYGRNGCDVYMDGQKCTITPEQKKEWEEGQRKIAEWKAKRERHEREHNAKRYGNTIGAKFGGLAESTKFTMTTEMKKMNENTKITLTFGQLRRLVNEDMNAKQPVRFNFVGAFPEEAFPNDIADGGDCRAILDKIDPNWEDEVNDWLYEEQSVEGMQMDVDDWDVWEVAPNDVISDDRVDEILYDVICDFDKYDDDGMANMSDISDEFLSKLNDEFENADLDDIESVGRQTWKARYHTGGYYPDA